MNTYLGNPSLSTAVKDRVSSTFSQAVELYKQGRVDEVIAGCGLILQMDPMFDPAKKLLQKARNPALPIDIESLVPSTTAGEALKAAREAMGARDFHRVINLTTEILTNDLMNDEARILGDQAREKVEAAPFIEQFARKIEQELAQGNLPAAKNTLEKARGLDSDHPSLERLQQLIARGPATPRPATPPPATPPAASPSFVVDQKPASRSAAQAADFGFTFEEEKAPAAPAAPAPPPAGGSGFSFDAPTKPARPEPASSPFSAFNFEAPGAPAAKPASPLATTGGFSFDGPPAAADAHPASPGSFHFDTPGAVKEAGSAEFDFSGASIDTSADDKEKIQQYLAEGDTALSMGDYHQAIEVWSRIFLIDVTNEQASERIERAKVKRREIDDQTEDLLTEGTAAFEKNDFETARSKFSEVLRIDPHNPLANDYFERLPAAPKSPAAPKVADEPFAAKPAGKGFDSSLFMDDELSSGALTPPDALKPPSPGLGAKKAAPTAKKPVSAPAKSLLVGLLSVIGGAIVVVALGWYGWTKFNSQPAVDPAMSQRTITNASNLAKRGQYDKAIALLRDVRAGDPQHDKALELIAELQRKKTQASETVNGRPASVVFDESIASGTTLLQQHDYDGAKNAFEQAQRIHPLPPDAKASYDAAMLQVLKLDGAKALFKERKFREAINSLQPLLQAEPDNKSIQRLITDAHFNLGAIALQAERLPDATREFDEVLRVHSDDEIARRSKELSTRYQGQPKDLLYKIYVKYLPMRQAL
ncbi:MAG TPA: tetratricopeptide repeat protein [Thermoanaerobaculia bacterium]|nr:tetratricopeptide repeat protein [Thermoanaerobaculia bacterium]